MKKLIYLFAAFVVALSIGLPVNAADGNVRYDGNAREFIFSPGSDYSPSDLFPNFKGVMPGDVLTQKITVKNDAAHNVNIKVYLRALGAHEDSEDFLSQLHLTVEKADATAPVELFDAAAHETAGLTDWVYLGELKSGNEVDLNVSLQVPVELSNPFQDQIGYLDWEFRVEEFTQGGGGGGHKPPAPQPTPQPTPGSGSPQTGDDSPIEWYFALMMGSLLAIVLLFLSQKRGKHNDSQE